MKRSFIPLLLGAWIALFACFGLDNNDTWWHLASGRWIWENRAIPRRDPFSFLLNGAPWIDEYWLLQPIWLGIWRAAGVPGLILFKVVWLVALFLGLGWALRRRGVAWAFFALAVVPVLILLGERIRVRPEIVSYAGLVAYLMNLPRGTDPIARRAFILLPILQIFWTNMHPGFLIGPVVIGLTGAGQVFNLAGVDRRERPAVLRRLIRQYALLLGLVLGASLVNPYGLGLHLLPFTHPETSVHLITEWGPPWTARYVPTRLAIPLLWALGLLALIFARRPPADLPAEASAQAGAPWAPKPLGVGASAQTGRDAVHWLWLAAFTALAWNGQRHTTLLALVWLIAVCEAAGPCVLAAMQLRPRLRAWATPAVALLLAGLIAATATGWLWHGLGVPRKVGFRSPRGRYPVGAADFALEHLPEGNGFNDYNIGGYVLWRLYPEKQIAVDGRHVPYGPELTAEALDVINAKADWRGFFARHGVHWAILSNDAEPLLAALWRAPDWHLVFLGERGVAFVDETGRNAPIARRFAIGVEDLGPYGALEPIPRGPRWLAPSVPWVAWRRATVLTIFGRPDLAWPLAERTLAEHPGAMNLEELRNLGLFRTGMAMVRAERWSEAEAAFRRLVGHAPDNFAAWINLGAVYRRLGRPGEAREAWLRAGEIDPNAEIVRRNLERLETGAEE